MLLIVITTLLAVSAKWALAQNTSTAGAFLEDVLPLRILATTPTALLSNPANAAVNITQEQAITVRGSDLRLPCQVLKHDVLSLNRLIMVAPRRWSSRGQSSPWAQTSARMRPLLAR